MERVQNVVMSARAASREHRNRRVAWALFFGAAVVYSLTISRDLWTTDVLGSNWTSWHIVSSGSPWVDGAPIPGAGIRSNQLLAIVPTSNGHTAFVRFPGTVVASLPTYLLFRLGSMSIVPGSLTAALLSALAVALMFLALCRHLSGRRALVSALVFGFATPVWSVSANLMWPHTITVLGIAGMAWAASSGRWWWAGVFGGIALWGRLHTAIIVAVLGLGVGLKRRDLTIIVKTGVASGGFLVASCAWNRWVYGSWNPLGGYGQGDLAGATESYRFSVGNQLGMWIAPDRGLLVWTPIVLLLLPALVRSWRHLPDWSTSLLVGGLLYTVTQAAMMTFTGGFGFYGYRYGLEFLACATPALAISQLRMGRVARTLAGPVLALQFFAFFLGATFDSMWLPADEAWHDNAFAYALDAMGVAGWMLALLVAAGGGYVAWRLSRHRPPERPSTPDTAPDTSRRDLTGPRPGL